MRWPWRRPRAAPLAFDASIDLDLGHVPSGARETIVESVRQRVSVLPGAGWVSVEAGGRADIRLFPAGSSVAQDGNAWTALRGRVSALIHATVPAADVWAPPQAAATGFAETMSPAQFDALAELAALASISRAPTPEPAPVPAPEPPASPRLAPAAPGGIERLATLLGFVLPVDGSETAAAAVAHFGSYAAVLAAPEAELRRVRGLGTHSIAAIKLVHAAAIRLARADVAARPVLDDTKLLADYLATALARERIEQFRILFLDARGMLRADEVQASGTVNHTPVYPREVVRRALALGATSLVLVHNHPSGDPAPSADDIEMTRQVRAAAAVLSIEVRDHVIIGNGRWLSFRESGLLD